jgi:V/A-type H+-transporting ATPase subunit C
MSDAVQQVQRFARRIVRKVPIARGNYPYVCARAKARKSLIYPPEMYQKFLQMQAPQISRTLGEGEYREELLALGAKYSGVNLIEMATRDNLAKTYTQIMDFSEGELKDIVSKFIDRWDVYNLQTILRCKFTGADISETCENLVAAGTFTLEFLQGLAEKDSIDEVVEALRETVYYEPLIRARESHPELITTAPLEDALSFTYYSVLLETVHPSTVPSKLFLEFLQREIDVLNLRTLLRLNLSKAKVDDEVFVPGGHELGCDDLKEMVELEWDSLVSRLRDYSFYDMIAAQLKNVKEKGLNEVMRALEKHVLKVATRYAHLHPLSILPVLDYMLAKKNEVDNIRIIARGKEHELDNELIKSLLVL